MSAGRGLERLELRLERLQLTFRFTYAFHAREVRFERNTGDGFARIFPETFSFRLGHHDPAELYLQLDDLARKPHLLASNANRRDADLLVSRLMVSLPRYLERLRVRLAGELSDSAMERVDEDIALLAQVMGRFLARRDGEGGPGLRLARFHLRKLVFESLQSLLRRRVAPDYVDRVVRGEEDPLDPADDLSVSGFFHILEGDDVAATSRALVRLTERAFYRWLEDVCLDEDNRAFEVEESPFQDREAEVLRAVLENPEGALHRTADLSPFLRRAGHRDCRRVVEKLSRWFLRQYDIRHAAAMIQHADDLARDRNVPQRVLSRHNARNYSLAMLVLMAPFAAAAAFYRQAPRFFDYLCAGEVLLVGGVVFWFLLYRFCFRRDLAFFHALVPRIAAGIIVGFLPIFFIDEIWGFANRPLPVLLLVSVLLGLVTLLYLYTEIQRRLGAADIAFARARELFLLGLLQAFGASLLITGLTGGFMASRNWVPEGEAVSMAELGALLPTFVGQLPRVVGIEHVYAFPAAIFVMAFLAFFIGTFLQLLWEDIPITEPL